jgi:transcriptional regulator with XRE-family HTH domain
MDPSPASHLVAFVNQGEQAGVRDKQEVSNWHHLFTMPTASRAFDRGTQRANRDLGETGEAFRERRLELGVSQDHVAAASRLSRVRYSQIERGVTSTLTILEFDRIAVVLGLSPSIRLFPGGAAVRDAGQSTRLARFLELVESPLSARVEVPLPPLPDRPERRAWDAVLFGQGERTAIELEMRLRDVQAMRRRHALKRRDDPTEHFLLLVADTRHNRRVIAEFAELFDDLPRLRPSVVRAALEAGQHPPTGLLLV